MRKLPEDLGMTIFNKRKLMLVNRVDTEAQELLSMQIMLLNNISEQPIELFIDSCGGDLWPATHIVDAIRISASPITGIVTGNAHSSAFLILQACKSRKAYPHATLLFHPPSGVDVQMDDEEKVMEAIKRVRGAFEEQVKEFVKRSGQSEENWRKWAREERKFQARQALELGMLDEIIEPVL